MKKVLLASTALIMSAGFAAADVSVGGDGRMGIIGGGTDDPVTAGTDETDLGFTSRIRISFSASGETDAGLAFGGTIRVDNGAATNVPVSLIDDNENGGAGNGFVDSSGGGVNGAAGSVFVEGTFGKISMGDVSGAAEAAVGDLSGVGLTGLGDANEMLYLSNGDRPAARWDYTVADFGIHLSADNPRDNDAVSTDNAISVAVTYSAGDISFGLGYEDRDDTDHVIAGVTAGFGDATVKAIYGTADDLDIDQYGLSLDFVSGATTLTAFYRVVDVAGTDTDAFGVGASYDLGGGAALKAGYVDIEGDDDGRYDMGISMSF